MSNKIKALRQTVGFFALASIGATLFVFGTMWVPLEFIVYSVIFGMIAFAFWMMYQVNLERLNSEEIRNKTRLKKDVE